MNFSEETFFGRYKKFILVAVIFLVSILLSQLLWPLNLTYDGSNYLYIQLLNEDFYFPQNRFSNVLIQSIPLLLLKLTKDVGLFALSFFSMQWLLHLSLIAFFLVKRSYPYVLFALITLLLSSPFHYVFGVGEVMHSAMLVYLYLWVCREYRGGLFCKTAIQIGLTVVAYGLHPFAPLLQLFVHILMATESFNIRRISSYIAPLAVLTAIVLKQIYKTAYEAEKLSFAEKGDISEILPFLLIVFEKSYLIVGMVLGAFILIRKMKYKVNLVRILILISGLLTFVFVLYLTIYPAHLDLYYWNVLIPLWVMVFTFFIVENMDKNKGFLLKMALITLMLSPVTVFQIFGVLEKRYEYIELVMSRISKVKVEGGSKVRIVSDTIENRFLHGDSSFVGLILSSAKLDYPILLIHEKSKRYEFFKKVPPNYNLFPDLESDFEEVFEDRVLVK
ncbi:MAG: hypothetical protein CL677_01840 [Bdellovibrionaceae bacterium]|nr:hypothetical protein [Pseudobdellovibrionaceae bacterium]